MRKSFWAAIILILAITLVFFGVYMANYSSDKYITVTVQTIADSETVDGYVVKNESVIDLSGGKYVRFYCENGDKVAARSFVASVYNNESDGNILAEIDSIDEKIANLSDEYVSLTMKDILKIENYIDSDINEYFAAVYGGNVADAELIQNRITTLLNIKHSANGNNNTTEKELLKERTSLEARLSSAKLNIVTPMGGIFTSETDGLEGNVDFDRALSVTVGEFDEIMKEKTSKTENQCKIVDNYQWYMMFKISDEYAALTSVGRKVEMTTEAGETVSGTVMYISAPENGNCIITVSSDRDFFGIANTRFMKAMVTFNKYSGYVIPAEAFHIYENKYGVFVKDGNGIAFRETDILYSNEEYSVVRPSGKTELKLYDNVLVEGDLSEYYD